MTQVSYTRDVLTFSQESPVDSVRTRTANNFPIALIASSAMSFLCWDSFLLNLCLSLSLPTYKNGQNRTRRLQFFCVKPRHQRSRKRVSNETSPNDIVSLLCVNFEYRLFMHFDQFGHSTCAERDGQLLSFHSTRRRRRR